MYTCIYIFRFEEYKKLCLPPQCMCLNYKCKLCVIYANQDSPQNTNSARLPVFWREYLSRLLSYLP